MNIINSKKSRSILMAGLIVSGLVLVAGCASSNTASKPSSTQAAKPADKPTAMWPLAINDPAKNQSGAEIWSENCMRCHQLRSPSQYSPAQWGVIIQYMRLKAGLTGEQARKVLAFLKSASAH